MSKFANNRDNAGISFFKVWLYARITFTFILYFCPSPTLRVGGTRLSVEGTVGLAPTADDPGWDRVFQFRFWDGGDLSLSLRMGETQVLGATAKMLRGGTGLYVGD